MACHEDKRLPDTEAAAIIENEGLGYAVQNYIDGDCFGNPETARLWKAAADALNALEKYLAVD